MSIEGNCFIVVIVVIESVVSCFQAKVVQVGSSLASRSTQHYESGQKICALQHSLFPLKDYATLL
jgi:hypothetical protein